MTRRLIPLLGLALALGACPSFPEHGHYACKKDGDCGAGGVCNTQDHNGTCEWPDAGVGTDGGSGVLGSCGGDADCQGFSGSKCINGVCRQTCNSQICLQDQVCTSDYGSKRCLPADGVSCGTGSSCPDGFMCGNDPSSGHNVCVRLCQTTSACLPGWVCMDVANEGRICVARTCGPTTTGGEAFNSTTCSAGTTSGTCVGPQGGPLGTDGLCLAPGSGQPGAACVADQAQGSGVQCAQGEACLPGIPNVFDATCGKVCKASSGTACAANARCYPRWGDYGVCITQQSGFTVPVPCTPFSDSTPPDQRTCPAGTICGSGGQCRTPCTMLPGGNDCGTASTCTSLGIPDRPYLGYCTP